jgi:two-component SAPR family response regulator
MPGLNGLELLKKVKNAKLRVRTILMGAYNLDEGPAYLQYVRSDYRFNY